MAKQTDYTPFLLAAKGAYFFRKLKPLSKALVKRIFDSAMTHASGKSLQAKPINKQVQVGGDNVRYSFLLFKEKVQPAFLDGAGLENLVHCYLLLCELPSTVVVFKSNADFNASDLEDAAEPLAHSELSRLYMDAAAAYERITTRMMTLSPDGIHSSSLAAPKLNRSMSTLGANRAIPTSLQVSLGDDTHGVTPNSGRISQRGERSSLMDLLAWALAVEEEIARQKPAVGFIDHFAASKRLSDLPANVHPTGVLFTLEALTDGVASGKYVGFWRRDWRGNFHKLADDGVKKLFDLARRVFQVEYDGTTYWIYRTTNVQNGELKKHTKTLTVSGRPFSAFFAQDAHGGKVALTTIINRSQDFLVCFSDPRFAYFERLSYDNNLLGQLDGLMSVFIPVPQLAQCTSEKGENLLTAQSTQFPATSVMGVMHQHIALNDDYLLCDDLNDEWADGIGVRESPTNSTISFYVAKHKKKVGLSASNFQDVIGQAAKNLSHVNPLSTELDAKAVRWGATYNLKHVNTQIARLLKGASVPAAVAAFKTVLWRPITQRRVCLVISFLSRAQLDAALNQLKNNGTGPAQLIQLVWIVSSFIGSCRDVGAVPLIYCRP